jgi:hypothetical protein
MYALAASISPPHPSIGGRMVAGPHLKHQNHIIVIQRPAVDPTRLTQHVSDWLDEVCWRCGRPDAITDAAGRVLCSSCHADLTDMPDDSADSLSVARHAYWESHVLQCCWRCMAGAVASDDEVGLCSSCRTHLAPA